MQYKIHSFQEKIALVSIGVLRIYFFQALKWVNWFRLGPRNKCTDQFLAEMVEKCEPALSSFQLPLPSSLSLFDNMIWLKPATFQLQSLQMCYNLFQKLTLWYIPQESNNPSRNWDCRTNLWNKQ